jgi:hypothetical protein
MARLSAKSTKHTTCAVGDINMLYPKKIVSHIEKVSYIYGKLHAYDICMKLLREELGEDHQLYIKLYKQLSLISTSSTRKLMEVINGK